MFKCHGGWVSVVKQGMEKIVMSGGRKYNCVGIYRPGIKIKKCKFTVVGPQTSRGPNILRFRGGHKTNKLKREVTTSLKNFSA